MSKHQIEEGKQKENIIVENFNVCQLEKGTRIMIGEIEFEAGNLLCCEGEKVEQKGERGIFLTPLTEGKLSVGDKIKLIN